MSEYQVWYSDGLGTSGWRVRANSREEAIDYIIDRIGISQDDILSVHEVEENAE